MARVDDDEVDFEIRDTWEGLEERNTTTGRYVDFAESFRCSDCRAVVESEYAPCGACGMTPRGEYEKHRKSGGDYNSDRRRRLRAERAARQRRDRRFK